VTYGYARTLIDTQILIDQVEKPEAAA